YMGGYHWTEIVINRWLIYFFAGFVIFVPILSLHFYLVFPRLNPVFVLYRRTVLALLYGFPTAYLVGLLASLGWLRRVRHVHGPELESALRLVRNLALGYVGLSFLVFGLCLWCLARSFRVARNTTERNQVRWILLASLLATLFIVYLLVQACIDPTNLGLD